MNTWVSARAPQRRRSPGAREVSGVRSQAAFVRALLDEVERLAPAGAEEVVRAQVVEEIARLGWRCIELAKVLTVDVPMERSEDEIPRSAHNESLRERRRSPAGHATCVVSAHEHETPVTKALSGACSSDSPAVFGRARLSGAD
jgi:hypothetical protein